MLAQSLSATHPERVAVDTTPQPETAAFSTDARQMGPALIKCKIRICAKSWWITGYWRL